MPLLTARAVPFGRRAVKFLAVRFDVFLVAGIVRSLRLGLMPPDGRLLYPYAFRVLPIKQVVYSLHRRVILCVHVFAGSTPKHSFRRCGTFRVSLGDQRVFLFGNRPPPAHKSSPGYPHLQLSAELSLWKIALDPPSLFPVRLHNENSRRPKRVEAFEITGAFLDVRLQGNEVLVDKGCEFIVGVGFDFQPNTGRSARRGAEIN